MERNYVNRTKKMNNGLKATVINQRGYTDIDVQFEDGTIVYHKSVENFLAGKIKYPEFCKLSDEEITQKYIGKTEIMNNNMKATIIAFRREDDIDVQFEDGTLIEHSSLSLFSKKKIKHPQITISFLNAKKKYIGMTNTMLDGLKATIIDYRSDNDIDVQFENGVIAHGVTTWKFLNGKIRLSWFNYHSRYLEFKSGEAIKYLENRIIKELFASSLSSFCDELLEENDEDLYLYLLKRNKIDFKSICDELIYSNDKDFAMWLAQRKKSENNYKIHQLEEKIHYMEKETKVLEKLTIELETINCSELEEVTEEYINKTVDTHSIYEITQDILLDILNQNTDIEPIDDEVTEEIEEVQEETSPDPMPTVIEENIIETPIIDEEDDGGGLLEILNLNL